MGSRLTKEIQLEVNAVQGSTAGFDAAIAQLTRIEQKIANIRAAAAQPIALTFTSNLSSVTGGLSGGGGPAGGAGFPTPAPPSPPPGGGAGGALPPLPQPQGFPIVGQVQVAKTIIKELADGTKSYSHVLKDAAGNTQLLDHTTKRATTTIKDTLTTLEQKGAVRNLTASLQGAARGFQEINKSWDRAIIQNERYNRQVGEGFNALGRHIRNNIEQQNELTRQGGVLRIDRAFRAYDAEVKNLGRSFDQLGAGVRRTHAQWDENNRILAQNKSNLAALEAQGFKPLAATVRQTANGVTTITQEFQSLDGRMARINYRTGEFSMQMQAGAKSARALGDSIGHTTSKVALWAISTGIIYGSIRSIVSLKNEMIAVEYQAGRLQRVFAGSAGEFERLKTEAIDLGAALGVVPSQALETAVSVARLQQDRVRTLELLRVALLAQNVAELSVEESLKFTISAILQFNMSSLQAIQVLNQWNELSNKNRVLTRDLGEAVSVAGKAFFEAGASLETLNAYVTVLAQTTGKTGSEIGTALRTIAVYSQDVAKAGKVSRIAGQEIYDLYGNVAPLGQIIAQLAVRFDTLTDAERNQVAQQIAGIRRRTQLLVLLREYPAVLTALTQQFQQENSALLEQEVVSKTLQFQIQQLHAEFGKLGVAVGDSGLAGFMHASVNASRLVISAFNDGNIAGRILLGAIQVLAARFLILKGAALLTNTEFKSMSALSLAAAGGLRTLGSASAVATAGLSALSKVVGIGAALYVLTNFLGKLSSTLTSFSAPKVFDEMLESIQRLSNEAKKLEDVEKNASDVAAAMRDLNRIEATGGKLTDRQNELKQGIIDYFAEVEKTVRTHAEVVQMLSTEAGLEQILTDIRSRGADAEVAAASKRNQAIIESQLAVMNLTDAIKQREVTETTTLGKIQRQWDSLRSTISEWTGIPEILLQPPAGFERRGEFSGVSTDDLRQRLEAEKENLRKLNELRNKSSEENKSNILQETEEMVKEHRRATRERIKDLERVADRQVKLESLFVVDEADKVSVEIKSLTKLMNDLLEEGEKLKASNFLEGSSQAAEFEEVTEAAEDLRIKIADLEAREVRLRISKAITDEIENIRRKLEFRAGAIDILSENALERTVRKYQQINQEILKLKNEISNASRLNLSDEEVMARKLTLKELERDAERAVYDIRLEQLRTAVETSRELEKQARSAEKSFLFADRETQARAAALQSELQRRGGERLTASEFALLAPEVRRIIADMVPGLLPIEALSAEMQKAFGAEVSQVGIGRFLNLPPEARRELQQTFPGMAPAGFGVPGAPETPRYQIPEIVVPEEKFKLPDVITVSADKFRIGEALFPLESVTDKLGNVLTSFTKEQNNLISEWSEAFSKQKQSQIGLDVDVDFAGVQGPLTNLVTAFTSVVETRLEEKINALAAKMQSSSAIATSRPNVTTEVI